MRQSFVLIFLAIFSCQKTSDFFELKEPFIEDIERSFLDLENRGEYFYTYLNLNYDKIDGSYNEVFHDSDSEFACSFSQNFESGIYYSYSSCNETGVEVSIQFPKVSGFLLRSLIEKLNEIGVSESYEEKYHWLNEDTNYEPVDKEAGCYYKIDDSEADKTRLSFYCGC